MKARASSVVAALLPVVVLLIMVVRYEMVLRNGTSVVFRITGYDPRDLLSGHYVDYRVDYGRNVCQEGRMEGRCLCLSKSAPATAVWEGACDDLPESCSTFIRGRCEPGRFVAGIERFYIPEEQAKNFAFVSEGTIAVQLHPQGEAVVTELTAADGRSLRRH